MMILHIRKEQNLLMKEERIALVLFSFLFFFFLLMSPTACIYA